MKFSDLFPDPVNLVKGTIMAPFEKREGQPWLQATARNIGHASFGDEIGNYVDQNLLGDAPPGAVGPALAATQIQPLQTVQVGQPNDAYAKMMQQWMQGHKQL